jgi:transcriptional regulator with XRE-family HTH domain
VAEAPGQTLAARLRTLRLGSQGGAVTQRAVATVLGVSVPLISSWESGGAVPTAERLRDYALAFAVDDALQADRPQLPDEDSLTEAQDRRRQALVDELIQLRDGALQPSRAETRERGELGGKFWYYPEGSKVRIITTKMWPSVLARIPYADPRHPNYIESFGDADRDATIELLGHIRAENPTADVRFLTADRATREDLVDHVVVLGQGDSLWQAGTSDDVSVLATLAPKLELPLGTRLREGGDPDFDSEFVTLDDKGEPAWFADVGQAADIVNYRPRFLRDPADPQRRRRESGLPLLEYDVALLARRANPFNLATSVTLCSGVFSRGTYGSVRTMTDASLRARNEQLLQDRFGDLQDFWLLFYVPVFQGAAGLETVTPDLGRPFHRLRSSAN